MTLLSIIEFPDPRLRIAAYPVTKIDTKITELADSMLETMYHADGIGLAATQVGKRKRIVVIDISESRDQPIVLINPSYEPLSNEQKKRFSIFSHFDCLDNEENFHIFGARKIHPKHIFYVAIV